MPRLLLLFRMSVCQLVKGNKETDEIHIKILTTDYRTRNSNNAQSTCTNLVDHLLLPSSKLKYLSVSCVNYQILSLLIKLKGSLVKL